MGVGLPDGVLVAAMVGWVVAVPEAVVAVGTTVPVEVAVGVSVCVGVFVGVPGIGVLVCVGVFVGVFVGPTGVFVGVLVGVFVGPTGVFVGVLVGVLVLTGPTWSEPFTGVPIGVISSPASLASAGNPGRTWKFSGVFPLATPCQLMV